VNRLAIELILIVKRGIGDGHPAHKYGLEPSDGRQRPGAPNLNLDGRDPGLLLVGREFIGEFGVRVRIPKQFLL
jgi:hypothetical protein